MSAEQLHFLASLDFPGRTTLLLAEMAERLGVSVRHLQREAELGALTLIDLRGKDATQPNWRCPIECYRDYVMARLHGPRRAELIAALPEQTRIALLLELFSGLPAAARSGVLARLRTALAA